MRITGNAPLTAEQLQAEMDRMATHSRQPEVLRELFAALGNDAFIIAECLARPALADRLLTSWYAYDGRIHGELKQRAEAELEARPTVEQMRQLSGAYSEIEFVKSDNTQDKDKGGSAPRAFGGDGKVNRQGPGNAHALKLNSAEWDATMQQLAATFNPPSAPQAFGVRSRQRGIAAFESADMSAHSKNAVAEMYQTLPRNKVSSLQEDGEHYYATAVLSQSNGRIKLATVSWLKVPFESWLARTENELPNLVAATGYSYTLPKISDEAACVDDTWTATAGPPDARGGHTAVWTGSEMIIWGGSVGAHAVNIGSRYNPSVDSWTATSSTDAPAARGGHTAVWTGNEMIVWGGIDESFNIFNTGGKYNPGTDTWIATSTVNAPAPREIHTAVWTGSEMIVWGGTGVGGYQNSGGRYSPNLDSWTTTSTTNAPTPRYGPTSVWTGTEMIVWRGTNDTMVFNTGGRYNPSTDTWVATSLTNAPDSRLGHTAIWSGTEMIVWGGTIQRPTRPSGAIG